MDIETFAHIVSHDLKGPLNGINSLLGFIIEDYSERLDDDGRDQLRLARELAAKSTAMIDALRALSRVAGVTLRMRPVGPADAIAQALNALDVSAGRSDVRIDVVSSLPDVWADGDLLCALFGQIIGNALTYNKRPVRCVEIGTRALPATVQPTGGVLLYVADNGIGIPEQHRSAVFDMFQRLHGRGEFGAGVGAGLTIAQEIVKRHGGTMWVESVEGEGSTFCFTLPRPLLKPGGGGSGEAPRS